MSTSCISIVDMMRSAAADVATISDDKSSLSLYLADVLQQLVLPVTARILQILVLIKYIRSDNG